MSKKKSGSHQKKGKINYGTAPQKDMSPIKRSIHNWSEHPVLFIVCAVFLFMLLGESMLK